MPDILDSINAQQEQKQVRARRRRRRLLQLGGGGGGGDGHVLDQSSNTDLLPQYRCSELRFPLFNAAKTTTLLKSQVESSVPRNGCPSKGVPLFQWSWPRNGRKPGWRRPLVRLPPLSITRDKSPESVNPESDLKAGSFHPELLQNIPPNVNPEETRLEIIPERGNTLKELDTAEREVRKDLPEIKRRQLVVVIPYIQYDSNTYESEESVEEDNDEFDDNNINEKYQKRSLKYHQTTRGMDKRPVQDRDNRYGKTICNKQSENRRLKSKSNMATDGRKSAQRLRVLMRKTIAATEARSEQCCFSSEGGGDSSDNGDKNGERSIVDFSHQVRVQWQKELREILNKSPDYRQDRDAVRTKEKPCLESCRKAAVLPPAASGDNAPSLQNDPRKSYDKLTESVKQNDSHLHRLGACYNLAALTHQVPMSQEIDQFGKRKQNPKAPSILRTKKDTRKLRNLRTNRERSPSDSFDIHFFWNLLESSKIKAGAGVKHSPNDPGTNSHGSSSELWAINSPVYKKVFYYKKKLK